MVERAPMVEGAPMVEWAPMLELVACAGRGGVCVCSEAVRRDAQLIHEVKWLELAFRYMQKTEGASNSAEGASMDVGDGGGPSKRARS